MWFFLHDKGEDTRKWDGEPNWRLEAQVQELQGKKQPKSIHSGKLLLQYLLVRVVGLTILLTLTKGRLFFSYKNQAMKTLTRIRGTFSQVEETTGFTGLCGYDSLASWSHGIIKL